MASLQSAAYKKPPVLRIAEVLLSLSQTRLRLRSALSKHLAPFVLRY